MTSRIGTSSSLSVFSYLFLLVLFRLPAGGWGDGGRQRREEVPCVPPYCSFECLWRDAADETAVPLHADEARAIRNLEFHAQGKGGGDGDASAFDRLNAAYECDDGRSAIHPLGAIGIPRAAVVGCVPAKYPSNRAASSKSLLPFSPPRDGFVFNGRQAQSRGGDADLDLRYRYGPNEEHEYKRQLRAAAWADVRGSVQACDTMRYYEALGSGTLPLADAILGLGDTEYNRDNGAPLLSREGRKRHIEGWRVDCENSATLLPRQLLSEAFVLFNESNQLWTTKTTTTTTEEEEEEEEEEDHSGDVGDELARRYEVLSAQALRYTRRFLTTRAVMGRVLLRVPGVVQEQHSERNSDDDIGRLSIAGATPKGRPLTVLYLQDLDPCSVDTGACIDTMVEYQVPSTMLNGLVDLLGEEHVVEWPPAVTARAPRPPPAAWSNAGMWGNGYTYANWLENRQRNQVRGSEDFPPSPSWSSSFRTAEDVEAAIRERAFDVVIYATPRRSMPFYYVVKRAYGLFGSPPPSSSSSHPPVEKGRVVFIDGEDRTGWNPYSAWLAAASTYVMRERPQFECHARDGYYQQFAKLLLSEDPEVQGAAGMYLKRLMDTTAATTTPSSLSTEVWPRAAIVVSTGASTSFEHTANFDFVWKVRYVTQGRAGLRWLPHEDAGLAAKGWVRSSFPNYVQVDNSSTWAEQRWTDRGVVLAAVAEDGRALGYAAEELRADRDLVMAAVAENGMALQYAAKALRADLDVAMMAVSKDGLALQFAAEELRADRNVVVMAVAKNGHALHFAAEGLRADQDVANLAAMAMDTETFDPSDPWVRSSFHRDVYQYSRALCSAFSNAISMLEADVVPNTEAFRATAPQWWLRERTAAAAAAAADDDDDDDDDDDGGREETAFYVGLRLELARTLLLFEAGQCPHFCHGENRGQNDGSSHRHRHRASGIVLGGGGSFVCSPADRLGPVHEAAALVREVREFLLMARQGGVEANGKAGEEGGGGAPDEWDTKITSAEELIATAAEPLRWVF